MLNERNEKTKNVIHLLVTARCDRDCPYCCNKQYDIKDIPVVYRTGMDDSDCEGCGDVKPDGIVSKSEGRPSLMKAVEAILG